MRRPGPRIIGLVAIALVLLAMSSHIRVAYLATLVLCEASSPLTDGPMASLRSDPVVERVRYEVEGTTIVADVYRPPGDGIHAGILLNHGVAAGGRSDPRLVNFADALARAGFVALVPEFTNLKEFRVRLSDVDEIIGSFEYLESLPRVDSSRVGLFGFSYAGGLSILAAGDPRIADRTRFCFSLGGYRDLESVVTFMTTGSFRKNGEWAYVEPWNSGRWAFLKNSVDLVGNDADRELLASIAERKLDDPAADVTGLAGALGSEGTEVYAVMVNRDPDAVPDLVSALNPRIRLYFDELSPRGRMEGITAHLILGHGRDDPMIPYTESILLAAEAPPGTTVNLKIFDSFEHVDLRLGGGRSLAEWLATVGEVRRLFSILYDLVSQGLR